MARLDEFVFPLDAPRKGENLPDQLGAAAGAAVKHIEQFPVVRGGHSVAEHRDAHHDGSKHIVEVVRDAAGKHADVFQPLRAEELGLQFLLFGNVRIDDQDGFRAPRAVVHEGPAAFDNDFRSAFGDLAQFAFPLPPGDQTF